MASDNIMSARVVDPLGVQHSYRGTGLTFANADAELKATLKVIAGTLLGVSSSQPMNDTYSALLVPSSQSNDFGDLRLTVFKVSNGKTYYRTIPLQDIDVTLVNTNGRPDKSKQAIIDIASYYEDADLGTGWNPYSLKWEKAFSGNA